MASRIVWLLAVAPPLLLETVVIASVVSWVGFEPIIQALWMRETLHALAISLFVASVAAGVAVLAATPTAYYLSRQGGQPLIVSALMLPLTAPPVAVGFIALVFLASTPLGRLLDELLGLVFSVRGAIAVQTVIVYPIALRMLMDIFSTISPGYEDVARVFGCKRLCLLRRVIIPLAWRGIVGSYGVAFARALGEFGATVMVVGANPAYATAPIRIYLSFAAGDIGVATALSLITMAVGFASLALYWLVGEPSWRTR